MRLVDRMTEVKFEVDFDSIEYFLIFLIDWNNRRVELNEKKNKTKEKFRIFRIFYRRRTDLIIFQTNIFQIDHQIDFSWNRLDFVVVQR